MTDELDLTSTQGLAKADDRRKSLSDRRREPRFIPEHGDGIATITRDSTSEALDADLLDISDSALKAVVHSDAEFALGEILDITWKRASDIPTRFRGKVFRIEAHSAVTVITITFDTAKSDGID